MRFTQTVVASAILALASAVDLSGQATFYGGNVAGGTCSFSTYTLPSGIFGTALTDSDWDNSANCGACVSVTGPSGKIVTAMIVDQCPGCGPNHLDLFPDTFAELADPSTGVIDVTWKYVDCPITTPLEVHNKEGVSAFWFSMQVVNANQAVSSLEVSTDGGNNWQPTTRQTYNFFEQSSGFGTTTVDVKVTADNGDVVVVKNVDISSGASTTASSNFGTSGNSPSNVAAVVATSSSTPVAAIATPASSPIPVDVEVKTTSSATATSTMSGAVFQEVSSTSTLDATTKHTTLSSTTTLYSTITIPKSTPTISSTLANTTSHSYSMITSSSVANLTAAANAITALPSGYSLSVMTISMCKPTILYSVVPIPSSSAIPTPAASTAAISANATTPAATATPFIFTGSASSMQASIFLAGFAGLLAFLI